MNPSDREKSRFMTGFLISAAGHLLGFLFMIVAIDRFGHDAEGLQQVFTVTLEGGEKLGGFAQAPLDDKKHVPPAAQDVAALQQQQKERAEAQEKEEALKLEQAAAIEEAKKEEAAKKEAAKLAELEKKKKETEKKAKAEEDKKKAEQQKKKEFEEQEKELAKQRKADRDKRLAQAIKQAQTKYKGESANVGGDGIGAAKLGGKGFGGGTLAPLAMVAYINQVDQIVRNNWSWMPGSERLQAEARINLAPNGQVLGAQILTSSGNGAFDESVLRAIQASDPFPPPPPEFYESQFKIMTFVFKPR